MKLEEMTRSNLFPRKGLKYLLGFKGVMAVDLPSNEETSERREK